MKANNNTIKLAHDRFNQMQQLMSELSDLKKQHQQKETQLQNQIEHLRGQVAMAFAMLEDQP